ncbi:MAG: NAD(P)(+) transhydrogenase (Re/Si-specific) subunit alpha, partial [Alphaproteobacteria bacterium]|nr:NAD(P)(+) transhydrogenase (Re/Si-specific) subunit alpha [Alphaproteobacteria bacterium]
PGAVIVDLAAETGGNCELTEAGKIIEKHGVTIVGHKNVPSRISASAAALYAKNLLNFLTLLIDKDSKKLALNEEDEIVKGVLLTRGGKIINPQFAPAKKEPKAEKLNKNNIKEDESEPAAKKSPARKKTPAKE